MYATVCGAQVPQAGAATTGEYVVTTAGAAQLEQPKIPALLNAGVDSTAAAKQHTIVRARILGFDMILSPNGKGPTSFIKSQSTHVVKERSPVNLTNG